MKQLPFVLVMLLTACSVLPEGDKNAIDLKFQKDAFMKDTDVHLEMRVLNKDATPK